MLCWDLNPDAAGLQAQRNPLDHDTSTSRLHCPLSRYYEMKIFKPEFEADPTTEMVVSRLEGDSVRK